MCWKDATSLSTCEDTVRWGTYQRTYDQIDGAIPDDGRTYRAMQLLMTRFELCPRLVVGSRPALDRRHQRCVGVARGCTQFQGVPSLSAEAPEAAVQYRGASTRSSFPVAHILRSRAARTIDGEKDGELFEWQTDTVCLHCSGN
jgi:hypothetical protein